MSRVADLIDDFALLGDWEERYRHVIELGQTLTPYPEAARDEAHKVRGCASQVWLLTAWSGPEGHLHLLGDSDAHIVRGLIAILVRIYDGLTPAQVIAADPKAVFKALGLDEHLSSQRANGLNSMVERIRAEAKGRAAA